MAKYLSYKISKFVDRFYSYKGIDEIKSNLFLSSMDDVIFIGCSYYYFIYVKKLWEGSKK